MTLRVVQWATGNVGAQSVRSLVGNPRFDLVGAYVYDPDKVGRDIGTIIGIDAVGIVATQDIDEILALGADCVVYNALGDTGDPARCLEDICRLLESGKNVVSTAVSTHIHPEAMDPGTRERLENACAAGGATFHSTGVNPGFAFDVLPVMASSIGDRIDAIEVLELVDMSGYTSKSVVADMIGMGMDPEQVAPMDFLEEVSWSPYYSCIKLLEQSFGAAFDDFTIVKEKAVTQVPIDLPWGRVESGTVAARRIRVSGRIGQARRLSYEMVWRVSDTVEPEWATGAAHYELTLRGDPTIDIRLDISSDTGRGTSLATSMHAVNAIPAVCAAMPGIVTRLDLPLVAGGYLSGAQHADATAIEAEALP